MDVLVSGEDDGEVRRVSLANSGRRPREIELTSYAEIVLDDAGRRQRASRLLQDVRRDRVSCRVRRARRHAAPRSPDEPEVWAAHFAVVEGELTAEPQYETDRARFLGRGRDIGTAAAIADGQPLSNTVGTVLDPIFSLRHRVAVPPGKVARVAFWTVVASVASASFSTSSTSITTATPSTGRRRWPGPRRRCSFVTSTSTPRRLRISSAWPRRSSMPIRGSGRRRRPSSAARARSPVYGRTAFPATCRSSLLRIDDIEDIDQVRQLLRAHEYWRMKRLGVDLVIINERASSYVQDLQIAIETAVRSSQSRPRFGEELAQGSVYVLRADLMSVEARALLQSVARVVLVARRGTIADQLARLPQAPPRPPPRRARRSRRRRRRQPAPTPADLEFFNGLGGFDKDGREYVTVLDAGRTTPAPWINVIANPGFGFQVSAEGSGYTWAENSRENQLTPWSNDPVADPPGEAIYVRDEETGDLWSPTAQPIRDGGTYIARHGRGYSRFEHQANGIALELAAVRAARRSGQDLAPDAAQSLRARPPAVGHGLCGMGARHLARRLRPVHHDRDRRRDRRDAGPQSLEHRASPAVSPLPTSAAGRRPGRRTAPSSSAAMADLQPLRRSLGKTPLVRRDRRRPRSLRALQTRRRARRRRDGRGRRPSSAKAARSKRRAR